MSKILDKGDGKSIQGKGYQYICTNCGCRFNAYYPEDYRDRWYILEGIYNEVECPICHKKCFRRGLMSRLRYLFSKYK